MKTFLYTILNSTCRQKRFQSLVLDLLENVYSYSFFDVLKVIKNKKFALKPIYYKNAIKLLCILKNIFEYIIIYSTKNGNNI